MASSTENTKLTSYNNLRIPKSQVVVVYTEWNHEIIDELRKGVHTILNTFDQIELIEIEVPGCFEIPHVIARHAQKYQAQAYIALGCIIKGETPHFDFVAKGVTEGIMQLNLQLASPTIFGILTVHTTEQAKERLGGKHGHKGEEAAIAALKLININNEFNKTP
ncbi:MAG: 6,7-dimethyl-8-ribityllumazine synthase [Chitinophagaceae bacterium]